MQPPERRSDRWISTALSVVLHGALVGALVYGWWSFRHATRPPPTLAIDATVVSSKTLNGADIAAQPVAKSAQPAPKAQPTPSPPKPPPPPPPVQPAPDDQTVPPPPDIAARKAAAEQAQADAERKAEEAAQQKKDEEAQRQAEQQQAKLEAQAEAKRKAKAEEAKKLAEAKAAEAKKRALAAEQQRLAEAKRKAEEQRRAEEAKALALNQADLQQSVAAEEKAMAARAGPAMTTWAQQIQARIERAWIRPPTAREGIDCFLDVTQVPGGQIVNVKVGTCNGDAAVVQSIQDAAYRASPLPPPPDPALFERDLQIEFKPTD